MFELFEHEADMGIRGIGGRAEEAFAECARAMFSVMVELEKVKPVKKVKVEADASDLEQLLVEFLNELIYVRDVRGMLFSKFDVRKIAEKGGKFFLGAAAFGEKIDKKKHGLKTEVKAASYSQLKVEKRADGKWIAQCIVDV